MNNEQLTQNLFKARRKTAICRLKLINENIFTVNGLDIKVYFNNIELYLKPIFNVLELFSLERGIGFDAIVKGSGKSSQSDSIKYTLARAIKEKFRQEFVNDKEKFMLYNKILRQNSLLTLDTRRNEPKRYGRKKSRKLRQKSKR